MSSSDIRLYVHRFDVQYKKNTKSKLIHLCDYICIEVIDTVDGQDIPHITLRTDDGATRHVKIFNLCDEQYTYNVTLEALKNRSALILHQLDTYRGSIDTYTCFSTADKLTTNDTQFYEFLNNIIHDVEYRNDFISYMPTPNDVVQYIKKHNTTPHQHTTPNNKSTVKSQSPQQHRINTHHTAVSNNSQRTISYAVSHIIGSSRAYQLVNQANGSTHKHTSQYQHTNQHTTTTQPALTNHYVHKIGNQSTWPTANRSKIDYDKLSYTNQLSRAVEKPVNTLDNYTTKLPGYNVSFTGLRNLGNMCYRNSVLQALMALPSFVTDLCNPALLDNKAQLTRYNIPNSSLIHAFVKLIHLIKSSNGVVHPQAFNNTINQRNPQFDNMEQQDAHEFFSVLLDNLNEDIRSAFIPNVIQSSQHNISTPTDVTPPRSTYSTADCTTSELSDEEEVQAVLNVSNGHNTSTASTVDSATEFDQLRTPNCSVDSIATTVTTSPLSEHNHIDLSTSTDNIRHDIQQIVSDVKEHIEPTPIPAILSPTELKHIHDQVVLISPICRNLQCEISSTLQCNQCKHTRTIPEQFYDISLDFDRQQLSQFNENALAENFKVPLNDMIQQYFNQRTQELKCDASNCTGKTVTIQPKLSKLPRVLVLHIKRFLPLNGQYVKLTRAVDIPDIIDMTEYCDNDVNAPQFNNKLPTQLSHQHNSTVHDNPISITPSKRHPCAVDNGAQQSDTDFNHQSKRRRTIDSLEVLDARLADLHAQAQDLHMQIDALNTSELPLHEVLEIRDSLSVQYSKLQVEISSFNAMRDTVRLDIQTEQAIQASLHENQWNHSNDVVCIDTDDVISSTKQLPSVSLSHQYKLSAVILHQGALAISGHYITDVYLDNQVKRYDDSRVITNPYTNTTAREAYLLFYTYKNNVKLSHQ